MIEVKTEGQVNTTLTRKKDTLTVFFKGMGMTVTILGDGNYTIQREGKIRQGHFADARRGSTMQSIVAS